VGMVDDVVYCEHAIGPGVGVGVGVAGFARL
jgi:hypothetical protein